MAMREAHAGKPEDGFSLIILVLGHFGSDFFECCEFLPNARAGYVLWCSFHNMDMQNSCDRFYGHLLGAGGQSMFSEICKPTGSRKNRFFAGIGAAEIACMMIPCPMSPGALFGMLMNTRGVPWPMKVCYLLATCRSPRQSNGDG